MLKKLDPDGPALLGGPPNELGGWPAYTCMMEVLIDFVVAVDIVENRKAGWWTWPLGISIRGVMIAVGYGDSCTVIRRGGA